MATQKQSNIEPALPIEETLKFNGKAVRHVMLRQSTAECLDPNCPDAWVGGASIVASGKHAIGTGHSVKQTYSAEYMLIPLPKP